MTPNIIEIQSFINEKQKIFIHFKSRFLREGFYKTSIGSIASELKVSKKTIYKYFPSKEYIVKEIVQSIKNDLSTKINGIVNSDKDSVTKSVQLVNAISSLFLKIGDKWLDDVRVHAPIIWNDIEAFHTEKLYNTLSSIIEQGKEENLFTDKPVEIIILIFLSSLRGIVNQEFLFHNRFSYREAVRITLEILFTGILTSKGLKLFYKSLKKV
jgi:AcrR family transcriptional regulator